MAVTFTSVRILSTIMVMCHDPEPLWTTQEVADFFRMPVQTIYRWNRDGKIPYFHVGRYCRYRISDVLKWLESRHSAL
jgi:excisionase family DNA binding protein